MIAIQFQSIESNKHTTEDRRQQRGWGWGYNHGSVQRQTNLHPGNHRPPSSHKYREACKGKKRGTALLRQGVEGKALIAK
jgi:hypothetical protein